MLDAICMSLIVAIATPTHTTATLAIVSGVGTCACVGLQARQDGAGLDHSPHHTRAKRGGRHAEASPSARQASVRLHHAPHLPVQHQLER